MGKDNNFGVNADALERAARAMRELNASPHAQQAMIATIKADEARKAQLELSKKNKEIEKVKIEQEQKRETLQAELENHKQRARYNDELERKRLDDNLANKEKSAQKIQAMQEESTRKQEETKKKTIEFEYKQKILLEEKRYQFEAAKQAKVQRENHDLELQNIQLKEQEKRQTLKEIFTLNFNMIGNGFQYLGNNPKLALTTGFYLASLTFGFYFSKNVVNLFSNYLASKFGKPALIRETSRISMKQFYKLPFKLAAQLQDKQKNIFKDVVLEENLQSQLHTISNAIINRKKNIAPLRNICFYGPPGTGKTLFAKKLAYSSGMDFAILAGSDVSPLQENAVTEIHKIFDWAEQSNNGIIVFIDEAEAFFRKRNQNMSENLRNSINSFLYRTGTPSKKVMFIIATNQPQQLDSALQDRIDQSIHFDLPEQEQRIQLLYMYLLKYCDNKQRIQDYLIDLWKSPSLIFYRKKFIRMETISHDKIKDIAMQLQGFSSREIEKLVIYFHDIAFSKEDPLLTEQIIDSAIEQFILQHNKKKSWAL